MIDFGRDNFELNRASDPESPPVAPSEEIRALLLVFVVGVGVLVGRVVATWLMME